jgi:uracil phosphoribosyltransferase
MSASPKSSVQLAAELCAQYSNLRVQKHDNHVLSLHTKIRDRECTRNDFVFHANRLMRLLVEEALGNVEYREKIITTPTGLEFRGVEMTEPIVGVSILRAGESMERVLRDVLKDVPIGKILIQRDESTPEKLPKMFYSKLPTSIAESRVLLLDPMLASGGSAICAIQNLMARGVPEHKITFVNLIACPEGLAAMFAAHPKVTVVTSMIDYGLNHEKYILPGIGDFGDLYFGTSC